MGHESTAPASLSARGCPALSSGVERYAVTHEVDRLRSLPRPVGAVTPSQDESVGVWHFSVTFVLAPELPESHFPSSIRLEPLRSPRQVQIFCKRIALCFHALTHSSIFRTPKFPLQDLCFQSLPHSLRKTRGCVPTLPKMERIGPDSVAVAAAIDGLRGLPRKLAGGTHAPSLTHPCHAARALPRRSPGERRARKRPLCPARTMACRRARGRFQRAREPLFRVTARAHYPSGAPLGKRPGGSRLLERLEG